MSIYQKVYMEKLLYSVLQGRLMLVFMSRDLHQHLITWNHWDERKASFTLKAI